MQLYASYWVVLPQEVRNKMKKEFSIQRSSGSHVEGGRVVSDGHTDEDLKGVTVEKMQKLLKSKETDQSKLIEMTVEHFTNEANAELKAKGEKEVADLAQIKDEEVKAVDEVVKKVAEEVVKRRKKSK